MKMENKTLKSGFCYRLMDSRLALAGQPGPEDFKDLSEQGFKKVINVRGVREMEALSFSVSETAKKFNLSYHLIPVMKEGMVDREALNKIHQILESCPKEKILIHCASGQRAVAALLAHLLKAKKVSLESAPSSAFEMGLQNEALLFGVLQTFRGFTDNGKGKE